MQCTSYKRQPACLIITALLLLAGPFRSYGEDTYNGTDLTIPFVVIGSSTYSNVVVTPERILAVNGGIPNGSADTYNPASNQLMIPAVYYAGTTYTNVVISVGSLIAVGNVRGVDFYASPELFIPSVQVLGGSIYSDVVITVDKILSAGGGMPENVQDVYDRATNQLTIAGIEYNGNVYTNAIVSVGAILSVGGSPIEDSILHTFSGSSASGSTDGGGPSAGVIQGSDGNFYGTTALGGAYGHGTVFKITPTGSETFYSFTGIGSDGGGLPGSTDGVDPEAGLIQASDGNFYGTTSYGGVYGVGTVFKITPAGSETVIYSFTGAYGNGGISGSPDGAIPHSGLIQATDGNFYGTTSFGGGHGGTVYRVSSAGVETVTHTFGASGDGSNPYAALIVAADGNFYGTTAGGGIASVGTVFKITAAGEESVLYSFGTAAGGVSFLDGTAPVAGLIQGTDGNFYGTTESGGAYGVGTVFMVTPAGVETVLHSFTDSQNSETSVSTDGAGPTAALIQGNDGNFYGTTVAGGQYESGTVFKITAAGLETVLHSFGGTSTGGTTDGAIPDGLIQTINGELFGTTYGGGTDFGTVFSLTPGSTVP